MQNYTFYKMTLLLLTRDSGRDKEGKSLQRKIATMSSQFYFIFIFINQVFTVFD